ncbi:MAG: hypothetical protein KAT28_04620 [Candidatus Aenigmarchaeota archaeon]|nr:hypothetical protein [Candidatus Aenigmarchaeota archaeon]
MSIIYEALKKVEGQKVSSSSESAPVNINLPIQKKEKKAGFGKKVFILPLLLLLIISGFLLLRTNSTGQGGKALISTAAKRSPEYIERGRKIDPIRIYRNPEFKSKVFEGATLKEEPIIKEYILEGIIYDQKAPSAIINGRVMKESDKLGIFRLDKISKDKIEMINIEENSKVTLSLP